MTIDKMLILFCILLAAVTIGGMLHRNQPPGPLASPSCAHFEVRGDFKMPWVRCVEDGGWASLATNLPGSLKGRTITLEVMK